MTNGYCLLFSFFLMMASWSISLRAEDVSPSALPPLPPEMQNLYLEYQDHLVLFKKQGSLSLDDQLFLIHQIHTNIIDINKRKKEFYAEFLNHEWSKTTSEKDHLQLTQLLDNPKAQTLLPEINFYKGIIFFSYESRKGGELFDIVTMMTEIDFEKGVANFSIYTIPRENSDSNKTVSLFSISDAHASFDNSKMLIDRLKSNKVVEKKALPKKVEFALDLFKVGAPLLMTVMTFTAAMSTLLIPLATANPPLAVILGVGIAGVLGTVGLTVSAYVGYNIINKYRHRSQVSANRFQNLNRMCNDELIDFHRRLGKKLLGYDYQIDFKKGLLDRGNACDVITKESVAKEDEKKGEQAQTCVNCQKKDEKKISYKPGIMFYASLSKEHDFKDIIDIPNFGISIADSKEKVSGFLNRNRKDVFRYIAEDSEWLYSSKLGGRIDCVKNEISVLAKLSPPSAFRFAFDKIVQKVDHYLSTNMYRNTSAQLRQQAMQNCQSYFEYKQCMNHFRDIVGLAKKCRLEHYKHFFYDKV